MIKRYLAGTPLGSAAIRVRDWLQLLRCAAGDPSEICNHRNNALAGRLVTRLQRPNTTFIDVGAHIGSIIGEALHNVPGRVIAFEAIPAKADFLRRRFPEVTIHNVALLDYDGETRFYVDNAQSGFSSLAKRQGDVTEITVRVARMDEVVVADDVDMIKIDVEGAELGVLQGAEGVIARCRPVVMFESGPGAPMGYTQEQMWRWLNDRDYLIYMPDRITRAARPATLEVFLDSHEYPRRTTNYFAIPAERMEEVSARARAVLRDPRPAGRSALRKGLNKPAPATM